MKKIEMKKKRKMVQHNLLKNSIAAYFSAIEIHNKPNFPYRYETVTLLLMNAWELCMKAFIKKYIKKKSIYENKTHTINFDKALNYVNDYINSTNKKKFIPVKENLLIIENYRNNIVHYYDSQLEPHIFMLVAKSTLNFSMFVKEYFFKDIIEEEGIHILPLGFKLPFKPEDFLSVKTSNYSQDKETADFIKSITNCIHDLKEQGIENSIVLGFDAYFENIKNINNSDLIVAIDNANAKLSIRNSKKINITDDKNAQKVFLDDTVLKEKFPWSYADIREELKKNKINIQNENFQKIMKQLKENTGFSYKRVSNPNSKKPSISFMYSSSIVDEIIKLSSI